MADKGARTRGGTEGPGCFVMLILAPVLVSGVVITAASARALRKNEPWRWWRLVLGWVALPAAGIVAAAWASRRGREGGPPARRPPGDTSPGRRPRRGRP